MGNDVKSLKINRKIRAWIWAPVKELRGIQLSFWLVQNLSASKKDSRLPKAFGIAEMKQNFTPDTERRGGPLIQSFILQAFFISSDIIPL